MSYDIKYSFEAQEFLDSLDLRFSLCKICPRANLGKEYGGIRGICKDYIKQGDCQGDYLVPQNEDCIMHDIYEKIEDAAFKLDGVFWTIQCYGKESIDRVRKELKNREAVLCLI